MRLDQDNSVLEPGEERLNVCDGCIIKTADGKYRIHGNHEYYNGNKYTTTLLKTDEVFDNLGEAIKRVIKMRQMMIQSRRITRNLNNEIFKKLGND